MKFKYYILSFVTSMMMMLTACSPDDHELGTIDIVADDLVEGIAFSITHDAQNPNIVYLENKMPGNYQVMWEHPQGRSLDNKVTLKIPFAGDYEVKFGVQTRGGYVFSNSTKFSVQEMCAEFISDPMWSMVAGGAGKSKTWVLDLDADAVSCYFMAPMYFFTADYKWDNLHNAAGADYLSDGWDASTAIVPNLTDGAATWYWLADYPGNSWMCETADFGTMTFDLIGGANVVTAQTNKSEMAGSYMLDTEAHTIKFSEAWPICPDARYGEMEAAPGRVFNILYLTEDAMQLLIPQSGTCLNFISQEYKENWSPEVNTDVAPALPADWRDYVEPKTNKVITYKLSDDTPFDWCNLDGTQKGIGGTAVEGIDEISLVMNSGTGDYTFTDAAGNEVKGKYTLNSEGVYTFDKGLPRVTLSADGKAVLQTNSDNTLRIMSYETDAQSGALTDLWLASKEVDDQGYLFQYLGYHWAPQVAGAVKTYKATLNLFDPGYVFLNSDPVFISGNGDYTLTINGTSTDPYGLYLDVEKILKDYPNMDIVIKDIKVDGTSIDFDDALIDRGVGDASHIARRYIVNPWGTTASDAAKYVFSSSLEVTITINTDNGTPFIPVTE